MDDPRRYSEDGGDEALRAGLAALRRERPSAEARDRALHAVLGTAAVASTLGAASAASGASATAAPAKATAAVIFAKWAGIGVVSATVVLGGHELATRPSHHGPAAASSSPRDDVSAATASPPLAAPVASATTSALSPENPPPRAASLTPTSSPPAFASPLAMAPSVAPTVGAPGSAPTASASAPAPLGVADEVQKLEIARAALRARNGGEARAAIAAYRSAFPRGVLASEAFVLEVEAIAIDDRAGARQMAERFLEKNPTSPLSARVRRAGGLPEPSAP